MQGVSISQPSPDGWLVPSMWIGVVISGRSSRGEIVWGPGGSMSKRMLWGPPISFARSMAARSVQG